MRGCTGHEPSGLWCCFPFADACYGCLVTDTLLQIQGAQRMRGVHGGVWRTSRTGEYGVHGVWRTRCARGTRRMTHGMRDARCAGEHAVRWAARRAWGSTAHGVHGGARRAVARGGTGIRRHMTRAYKGHTACTGEHAVRGAGRHGAYDTHGIQRAHGVHGGARRAGRGAARCMGGAYGAYDTHGIQRAHGVHGGARRAGRGAARRIRGI